MAQPTKKTNPCVKGLLYVSTLIVIVAFLALIAIGILIIFKLRKVIYILVVASVAIVIGVLGIIASIFGIWGLYKNQFEGKPKYAVLFFAGTVIILQVLLIVIGFLCFFARPTVDSLIVLNQSQLKTWFSGLSDAEFNTLIDMLKLAVDYLNIVGAIFFVAAAIAILILILLCVYVGKLTFSRFLITSSSIVLIVVGFALAIFLVITNPSSITIAGQQILNKWILTSMMIILFAIGVVGIFGLIAAKCGSKLKILSILFIIAICVLAAWTIGVFIAASILKKRYLNGVDSFCDGEVAVIETPEEEEQTDVGETGEPGDTDDPEDPEGSDDPEDPAMNYNTDSNTNSNSDSNPKYLPFDIQIQPDPVSDSDSVYYAIPISISSSSTTTTTNSINSAEECAQMLLRLRDSKCGKITESENDNFKCRNDLTNSDVIDLLKKMKGGWVNLIISVAIYVTVYLILNVFAGIYNCVKKEQPPKATVHMRKMSQPASSRQSLRLEQIEIEGDEGNRF